MNQIFPVNCNVKRVISELDISELIQCEHPVLRELLNATRVLLSLFFLFLFLSAFLLPKQGIWKGSRIQCFGSSQLQEFFCWLRSRRRCEFTASKWMSRVIKIHIFLFPPFTCFCLYIAASSWLRHLWLGFRIELAAVELLAPQGSASGSQRFQFQFRRCLACWL